MSSRVASLLSGQAAISLPLQSALLMPRQTQPAVAPSRRAATCRCADGPYLLSHAVAAGSRRHDRRRLDASRHLAWQCIACQFADGTVAKFFAKVYWSSQSAVQVIWSTVFGGSKNARCACA